MSITATRPAAPSADPRWKLVSAAMRRHGYAPDALIETLHAVQQSFGFLDEEALKFAAGSLRVPYSRVYGVATFYHLFTMRPPGRHTCVVCLGTACYIRGAQEILGRIEGGLGVQAGGTTADGAVSLLTARCLGACGLAPAVVYDGNVVGKLDAAAAAARAEALTHDA